MRKLEPIRPRLAKPPKLGGMCLGSAEMEAVLTDQPPRKGTLPSIANGTRLMGGLLPHTTPSSVTDLIKMVSKRTSLPNPSIPQRSPGKGAVEIPARWFI
jgi:hypothetical protein